MKNALGFERKEKLNSRFIEPFEILEWIGLMTYRLGLPPSFSVVYDVFHVLMLRKYITNPSNNVDHKPLQIEWEFELWGEVYLNLARKVKSLVQQGDHFSKGLESKSLDWKANWEGEYEIIEKYLELVQN